MFGVPGDTACCFGGHDSGHTRDYHHQDIEKPSTSMEGQSARFTVHECRSWLTCWLRWTNGETRGA